MANLAIRVSDVTSLSLTMFSINILVGWTTPQSSNDGAGGDLSVAAESSADAINAAIRQKGIDIAAAHGITVGPADVVRVFGGALPNIS